MTTMYRLVPHEGNWALQKDGSDKVLKVFSTKKEGLRQARHYAAQHEGKLSIHRANGTVENVITPRVSRKNVSNTQHVVPHKQGWAVVRENAQRPTQIYFSKVRAIAQARKIAKNQDTSVVVHDVNGKIAYHDEPKRGFSLFGLG